MTALVVCYNHARFVRQALDSVLAQNYPNLQLIIADDCSRDESVSIIRDWLAVSGIEALFLPHDRNVGLCRTLNEMLGHARGKYISSLATDDAWREGKLRTQVLQMESFPEEVGVLYSDAELMDESGQTLSGRFIQKYRRFEVPPTGWVFDELIRGNFIPAMSALVRRRCFDEVGGYDESLYIEDWDMWLRIARRFRFHFSDEVSARYRIVSSSMTNSQPRKVGRASTQTLLKCADEGWLPPDMVRWVLGGLASQAVEDFLEQHPDRFRTTSELLRRAPTTRHGILWAFCQARIPPRWYVRLRGFAGRLRSGA